VISGETAKMLVDIYKRWLFEVWGSGDEAAARELVHTCSACLPPAAL
jgi:hypothetical protein